MDIQMKTVTVKAECEFSHPQWPGPGHEHRCVECGEHRFAAIHRTHRALVDDRTDIRDVGELGYEDAGSVERQGWRVVGIIESFSRHCSEGYFADTLAKANMKAFEEIFDGVDYVEGRAGLLYNAEDVTVASALISTFDALEDYPVIDEEILSRLEDEEFWEALTTCFDIPDDVAAEAVARWLQEHTSCYLASDLTQERIYEAVGRVPHEWRNRLEESVDETDPKFFSDPCTFCGHTLSWHSSATDAVAAEAAGQLPLMPELAFARQSAEPARAS
jgi:hypothetical protein